KPNEGATVSFTITLSNAGPDTATGVAVTDLLPAGLLNQSATASQGSYASGTGVWSVGTVPPSTSVTLTLVARIGVGTGGSTLTNTATISASDQLDLGLTNNTASRSVSVPLADLSLRISNSDSAPMPGDVETFTVRLNNNGPNSATGVTVRDLLPPGLTYQSSNPSQGTYSSATGIWTVGNLSTDNNASLSLSGQVNAGTIGQSITDTATVVAADQADDVPANNTATNTIVVGGTAVADLAVTLGVDDPSPFEGGNVSFTVSVLNNGPGSGGGVRLVDLLPAGLTYTSSSASQGSYQGNNGTWNVGTLANGSAARLIIGAVVNNGSAGTTVVDSVDVTASDRPDLIPDNNGASVTLTPMHPATLSGASPTPTTILPGAPSQELWRLTLRNVSTAAETLSTFAVTNDAIGPGTTADLDGDWTPLTLTITRGGTQRSSAAGSFVSGRASFTGLSADVPAGDSLLLALGGSASLHARDPDILGLGIPSPGDLTFTGPVKVLAGWPVVGPELTVDGMAAGQIAIHAVGPGNIVAGTTRRPALDVTVPANGYEPDRLEHLGVVNLGSAVDAADLTRVEAWVDDGDGVFSTVTDRRLGAMIFTGSRWEITGLAEDVGLAGLHLFVTADVSPTATDGRTIRFALPTLQDVGVGMTSDDGGPVDHMVEEPLGLTISRLDHLSLAAVPVTPATARPGDRGLTLVHLVATNSYDTDRSLTDLTVTDVTQGSGSTPELDAETRILTLRADGDNDGVLGSTTVDPVLGTGFFSSGRSSFSGLRWLVPAGQTRHLFVTADLSPGMAADGDVLAGDVSGESSVAFAEPTAVTATWPLDSGARWTIDGFTAAQLTMNRVQPVTIGPNDGPILALDFVAPPNGYMTDDLRSLRVVNLGTAGTGEIRAMTLWRDGGDGVFTGASAGDDSLVGPLVPQAGGWQSPLISLPVGVTGLRSFVAVEMSNAPAESTTVRLAVPLNGMDNLSGDDGPLDAAVANPDGLLISGAPLLASLSTVPASTIGQTIAVRMMVRNTSSEMVTGIVPSALVPSGTGSLSAVGGPVPASFNLAPAAVDTFVFQYSATAVGDVRLSGNASGTGATSGLSRRSPMASSGLHQVFVGANLLALTPVQTMPTNVNRGQTGVVPFSLTLTNNGGAGASDARLTSVRIRIEDPSGAGIVPSQLLTRLEVNEGTNVYLVKTAPESTGADVDLNLSTPVTVSATQPTTLTLRLDLSPVTTVPAFRVTVPDSTRFIARDATDGSPVTVAITPGGYPLRSDVARVVAEATLATVDTLAPDSARVSRGNTSVPLLGLRLGNPGITGISSDVRVYAFAIGLEDSTGAAIANPSTRVTQIRIRQGAQIVATRAVLAGDGPLLPIAISPPLDVAVNTPLDVRVEADIADTAAYGRFHARLADSTTFDARDATTRNPVPARYAHEPILGGWVTVERTADTLWVGGTPTLPPAVLIGGTRVPVFTIHLRHPGDPGTSRLRLDDLAVDCRDDAGRLLAPATYFTRLHLSWNGVEVATVTNPPASGGVVDFPLPGLLLEPGDTASVAVSVDINPASPAGSFEMMIPGSGFTARDANSGRRADVVAAPGASLPVLSGLGRLQSPARTLAVGLTSLMPAALVSDGRAVDAAVLALTNTDGAGAGSITLDHLTFAASDRVFAPLAVGAGAYRLEAWIGATMVAVSAPLTPDSTTADLAAIAPFAVAPGETVSVAIRVVPRSGTGPASYRLGCYGSGIGVVQPGSALLAIAVQPMSGRVFPMWTEAGGFTGSTLSASYSNYPNPFAAGREATHFVYYLPQSGTVSIHILTPRGESVATVLDGAPRGAGLHQGELWDGRNGQGHPVFNGIYVAELTVRFDAGGGDHLLRKVAVVR
ncbi:MAG: hypothetical protein ACHQ52_08745, partial [Candidatus Eisenbacteria bacterium]